jgi:mannose-1-phosphate guanylyltransferase
MSKRKLSAHAVILAGGRGTRFWPRSRTRTPKQLLNIVGDATMLQQTVERLRPAFAPSQIWIVTNEEQAPAVRRQVPIVPYANILTEPRGRNTAAAIGLAAMHILKTATRQDGDALMAVLPADHYIGQPARYLRIVRAALELAERGENLVVLGILPTRPETGYGYVQRGARGARVGGCAAYPVRRFTEKPGLARARQYVASGRYFWNAGMFFWRASSFLKNLKSYLPNSYWALHNLSDAIGAPNYPIVLRRTYGKLESISVDYAILEPATRQRGTSNVYVLPAKVGWSDIGSWAAVYELLAEKRGANVCAGSFLALDAEGNFLWSPEKFIAAIGVKDLVVVESRGALLICPRERAQDVGKAVKWLEEQGRADLL